MYKDNLQNRETDFKSTNTIINFSENKIIYKEGLLFNNWNLIWFKTKKCKEIDCKNQNICVFYHGKYDKRRSLINYNYDIKLCENSNNCTKNDLCKFSHNKVEILYHNFFFKKKYCIKYYTNKKCIYDKFCSFAHCDEELRINLLHKMKFDHNFFLFYYKTEFCPLGNIQHDKNKCVYAHNFQDYKRRSVNSIIPIKCRNWNLNISYSNYNDGCKFSNNCKFGHGWKELSYNPIIYKTQKCKKNEKECLFKNSCHYYHNDSELKKFKKNENDFIIIVPKNKLSNLKFKKFNYDYLKNRIKS